MTSIIFPTGGPDTAAAPGTAKAHGTAGVKTAAEGAAALKGGTAAAAGASHPPRDPTDWRGLAQRVLTPLVGMALLVGIWALLTQKGGSFPTPLATFDAAVKLFADPLGLGMQPLLSASISRQRHGAMLRSSIPTPWPATLALAASVFTANTKITEAGTTVHRYARGDPPLRGRESQRRGSETGGRDGQRNTASA